MQKHPNVVIHAVHSTFLLSFVFDANCNRVHRYWIPDFGVINKELQCYRAFSCPDCDSLSCTWVTMSWIFLFVLKNTFSLALCCFVNLSLSYPSFFLIVSPCLFKRQPFIKHLQNTTIHPTPTNHSRKTFTLNPPIPQIPSINRSYGLLDLLRLQLRQLDFARHLRFLPTHKMRFLRGNRHPIRFQYFSLGKPAFLSRYTVITVNIFPGRFRR